MQPRSGIDADLLQQTVQAVVAAVTAATIVAEPIQSTPTAANIDIVAGGKDQHVMTPVAAPNVVPQPAQGVLENQDAGAKGKDNVRKRRRRRKNQGAFDANNLDIILMTVHFLPVIYGSLYTMLPMLVIFIKLQSHIYFTWICQ
jgi:hypothetical protein